MASIPPRHLMLLLLALPGGFHLYTLSLCDAGVLHTISSFLLVVIVHQDLPLVSVISQVPLIIHSSTSFALDKDILLFLLNSCNVVTLIHSWLTSKYSPHWSHIKLSVSPLMEEKWNTQTTVSPIVWETQTKCLNISTRVCMSDSAYSSDCIF